MKVLIHDERSDALEFLWGASSITDTGQVLQKTSRKS